MSDVIFRCRRCRRRRRCRRSRRRRRRLKLAQASTGLPLSQSSTHAGVVAVIVVVVEAVVVVVVVAAAAGWCRLVPRDQNILAAKLKYFFYKTELLLEINSKWGLFWQQRMSLIMNFFQR